GRRHAEYLARMLEMFERGDWDQALRHAVPLGGDGGDEGDLQQLRLAAPKPRRTIAIELTRRFHGAGSSVPLVKEAMAQVRQAYEQAAARLEAAGRIEEAA